MSTDNQNHQELESYIPFLYAISFKLTQNRHQSEDLVQETLLRAWQNWSTLKDSQARKAWLRKICTNCFLMEKRRSGGYVPLSLDALMELEREGEPLQLSDTSPLPEEEVVVEETIREMRDGCFLAMTRKLTLSQRMAFSLIDMFGMGIAEAADILEVSVPAAKALLHRARMNLDNFFSQRCNLIRVENPCSCESYLNFQNERAERQEEIRSRIQTFRFGEQAEGYVFNPEVRQKVTNIYAAMPDRKPDPAWFESILQSF